MRAVMLALQGIIDDQRTHESDILYEYGVGQLLDDAARAAQRTKSILHAVEDLYCSAIVPDYDDLKEMYARGELAFQSM